jgi:hypothetical protein
MASGGENWNSLIHLAAALVMLSIFFANLTFNRQRGEKRSQTEAARLQAAFATELQCLAELYRKNLELLRNGSNYLLSTRSAIPVYRGNVGRLTLLDEAVIRYVVMIHSENEQIEILLAARAKVVQKGHSVVYRFEAMDREFNQFKRMYALVLEKIERACEALNTGNALGEPAPPVLKLPREPARLAAELVRTEGSATPKIPLAS